MSKAQNRHDTIKWKKKRKNHYGDKCKKANCIICTRHKLIGNSAKMDKPKYKIARETLKQAKNELSTISY